MYDISVTDDTSHKETFPLNDVAPTNILEVSLTDDKFQLDISPLKAEAR
jgi:hypothetical protein